VAVVSKFFVCINEVDAIVERADPNVPYVILEQNVDGIVADTAAVNIIVKVIHEFIFFRIVNAKSAILGPYPQVAKWSFTDVLD
jgi:hypothetical protein